MGKFSLEIVDYSIKFDEIVNYIERDKNWYSFKYPNKYEYITNLDYWRRQKNYNIVTKLNNTFLENLDANIYILSVDSKIKYIGKSKNSLLKSRLKSHLVYKSKNTTSKFYAIKKAVNDSQKIKVCVLKIEPEDLNAFIEIELINYFVSKGNNLWNKKS